jgi:glycosyltransferase involved in cell wall biosynthesis
VTLRPITDGEQLGLTRGAAVVCIPVGAADAQMLATVRSVMEHSEASTPVIVAGPPAAMERIAGESTVATEGGVWLGLTVDCDTDTAALNAAVKMSFPGDVVAVAPGVRVTTGWLDGLRAAALSDSTVASATPLSLSESTEDIDKAAHRVRERALRLYPRTATIGPGCAYIRRSALELAGPLDGSLALDGALASFALRALALGMVHVAADDVLIEGPPDGSEAHGEPGVSPGQTDGPVQETIAADEHGPLHRALNRARGALSALSVTIDGRALVSAVGGTQTYIIELVLALARQSAVSVRVLVPPDLSDRAADAFNAAGGIELLSYEQAIDGAPLTDVIHRPQQVFTPDDLGLLRLVGERVIIGQQDLIGYHNPSYHPDIDSWRGYRRTTRLALAGADQVVFFSNHARDDALAEDLLPGGRTHVVGIAPEALEHASVPDRPPDGLSADGPFLLCLGADYAHKNRPFAIELLGALRDLGWHGRLVLAGTHVPHGSSRERERALLGGSPDLAGSVLDLGQVDEPCRRWLYGHASALSYPTTYEGFGLLPFEAAQSGLPCLFAAQASLAELAGDAATLIPWDAHASAAAVLPLLSDGPARDHHLSQLRALPVPSADDVAQQLIAVYEQALSDPPSEAAPRIWQELDRERYIVRLDHDIDDLKRIAQEHQDAYHALEDRVRTGLPLIDTGGLLTPAQQRGLMRVAARRGLGSAVLAPFGVLGRLGGVGETLGERACGRR